MTVNLIGIGGAGGNILEYVYNSGFKGNYFLINNLVRKFEDKKSISQIEFPLKEYKSFSMKYSEKENQLYEDEILPLFNSSEKFIIFCGMGGITGSNILMKICETIPKFNPNVFIFITLPFNFEGNQRKENALTFLEQIKKYQLITVFDNEEHSLNFDKKLKLKDFFEELNEKIVELIKNKF